MPDLEAMKQSWAEHDRKLEASIGLSRLLLRARSLDGARGALERMNALLIRQAVVWSACMLGLGRFLYDHFTRPPLALSALAVDLFAWGMLISALRQMIAIRRIDYASPVTAIQHHLEALRRLRIRTTQAALLAGGVIWAPFAMVVLQALFGVEFYNPAWLWANVGFGLAVVALGFYLSARFAARAEPSDFLEILAKDIAGKNLAEASRFLAGLSEFESVGAERI